MSKGFIQPVRIALERALDVIFGAELSMVGADLATTKNGLKLRPPKNDAWGDLCTNVLLLLCGKDRGRQAELAPHFIEAFQKLSMVRSATVSDAGYINIRITPEYWGHQTLRIVAEGTSFGLEVPGQGTELRLQKPNDMDDLLSARQAWNAEGLARLAEILNRPVLFEPWQTMEGKGFPSAPAIAKCTIRTLRLSLLSTGGDFAVHFSPMLAVDKAYSNAAFCIPYAHARIVSLLTKVSEKEAPGEGADMILTETVDEISFSRPLEQKIAKFLCDWPNAVEQSLKNRDMVHLTTFLHDLSLLFFQLVDQERLQSSDYLFMNGQKTARKLLLQAVDTLIRGGLDILGIDIVEEFS